MLKWNTILDSNAELEFSRRDTSKDAIFEISLVGEKINPFSDMQVAGEEVPVRTMMDKLQAGIGSELRYKY